MIRSGVVNFSKLQAKYSIFYHLRPFEFYRGLFLAYIFCSNNCFLRIQVFFATFGINFHNIIRLARATFYWKKSDSIVLTSLGNIAEAAKKVDMILVDYYYYSWKNIMGRIELNMPRSTVLLQRVKSFCANFIKFAPAFNIDNWNLKMLYSWFTSLCG